MALCESCKNKNSLDRCSSPALKGLLFCGKHVKVKEPRVWKILNKLDDKVTLITKIWRGYSLRKLIKLAGPGLFNRSLCVNEDELMSLEPMKTVSPFDYFGFEENDKIYGFDIRTVFDTMNRNLKPINPYTRQPISIEDRKRLRELYAYRFRRKLPVNYENNVLKTTESIITNRWQQISQICEENGFTEPQINPNFFLSKSKIELYTFLRLVYNDMRVWANEHKDSRSRRFYYAFWILNVLNKYQSTQSTTEYCFYVSTILLTILYDSVEPYTPCFIIMSALYRL
jgi:hypothetical protein